jgi:methyl-accepting chemotaxis protein-1 (serine sensor receptor)
MRLIATMAMLGLIVLSAGGVSLWGMHRANAALNVVYRNQLTSAVNLGSMKNYLSRARFAIDRAQFRPQAADASASLGKARDFIRQAELEWQSYLALPLSAGEREMAMEVTRSRDAYVNDGLLPVIRALSEQRVGDSEELIFNQLGSRFVAFDNAWNKLQEYQLTLAKAHYDASQSFYAHFRLAFSMMLVLTGVLIIGTCITLLKAIMQPVAQALHHFGHIAQGNLAEPIHIARADEMGHLLKGLVKMQQQLLATVRTVRDGSTSIAQAAGEISAGNLDLSTRTEQQAASLEETAASLEQLTSTVRQNTENARHANRLALDAARMAADGGARVADVIVTMADIEQSSRRVVDIIAVIDGIAFQTNILALNAAVEAARAGEAGRGFAVVASEVRNLAQRAASAAREIKDLIEQSVQQVAKGSGLVAQAGASVHGMVDSVARVNTIMAEILVASEEQSAGIHQIHGAVAQMDAATQQNAALVEQASAAAGALEQQADTLDRLVSGFRLDAGATVPHGRAAAMITRTNAPARQYAV